MQSIVEQIQDQLRLLFGNRIIEILGYMRPSNQEKIIFLVVRGTINETNNREIQNMGLKILKIQALEKGLTFFKFQLLRSE